MHDQLLLKTLFIVPEVRLNEYPYDIPFWAGILAAIAEKKSGEVGILDLNALRINYGLNKLVPNKVVQDEINSAKWDLVCIGGLTTTYRRIKQLVPIIRKSCPGAVIASGGGWATYNPDEILQLVPDIDLICIGEGEETFAELYDELNNGSRNFEKIKGLCLNNHGQFKFTEPRALISDLDTVPYPAYHLFELDIYFKYSALPYSVDAFNAKRRIDICWERGCPRGCTFCSHNGMSRGDLQNIYGDGNRLEGEKLVRLSDKANDTFQLPARWPSPKYAVENIKFLLETYNIDFVSIVDENMTSNKKWTEEFCTLYMKEGLHKKVKWGTLGDAPSVATQPGLLKIMKDAGCSYISFGFESASDKVLNQDIKKGQLQIHEQKTIDAIKQVGLQPIATFMIGNPHENINDLMETVEFWIKNNIIVDPFICTPFVGSPLYYDYKDFVLQQYDERLKLVHNNPNHNVDKETIRKWKLEALDKFMKECGNATDYTATVSQYFTIPELFALKRFMYKHDTARMLKMAHERYEQTRLEQWNHSEKWTKYCDVCKAKEELSPRPQVMSNN